MLYEMRLVSNNRVQFINRRLTDSRVSRRFSQFLCSTFNKKYCASGKYTHRVADISRDPKEKIIALLYNTMVINDIVYQFLAIEFFKIKLNYFNFNVSVVLKLLM